MSQNNELRDALQALHDDVAEYQRINNLGGYDNHCMKRARAALAAQPAVQKPYAYAVYFPDQPTEMLTHELDDLCEDMTNREHSITELFSRPAQAERNFCQRCGKRLGAIKSIHTCTPPAPVRQPLTTTSYRLLELGVDTIQAGDEFLKDDCSTWVALVPNSVFVGWIYAGHSFLPIRRAIEAKITGAKHE